MPDERSSMRETATMDLVSPSAVIEAVGIKESHRILPIIRASLRAKTYSL